MWQVKQGACGAKSKARAFSIQLNITRPVGVGESHCPHQEGRGLRDIDPSCSASLCSAFASSAARASGFSKNANSVVPFL